MKNYLLKAICLMALAFVTSPILANDYLKIYFKDGHTERHYMKLVESISATKYDLEGNLHDDYQMQQIVMPDTTYSYYLADIDSMSFKKVYEGQLRNDVETVSNTVTPIFEQCSTYEEMEEYIDEIKNIEGVEDVWGEGSDIVIQIRDWHKVFFTFPLVNEDESTHLTNISRSLNDGNIKHKVPLKSDGSKISVIIAYHKNNNRFEKESLQGLTDILNEIGFEAHLIPDEETGDILDLNFYEERMFNYDIVILITHGSYSRGKHHFFTSVGSGLLYNIGETFENTFDVDDISWSSCKTDKGSKFFKTVSEDFIRKSDCNFDETGPHIVFSGACKTLKGDETLTYLYNGIRKTYEESSDAVAQLFLDKGADVFLGYNHKAKYNVYAACQFFINMLLGDSQEAAYCNMDDGYKKEETEYGASLILVNSKTENNIIPNGLFITNTQTAEKTQSEIDNEILLSGKVKLEGMTTIYNKAQSGLSYGFRLGLAPKLDKQDEIIDIDADNVNNGDEAFLVDFSTELISKSLILQGFADPGTKIYYRAFTYDGIHHNWGEERSFTLPSDLVLSAGCFLLNVGESTTVQITSGNGSYTIESNSSAVTAELNGNIITITAVQACDDEVTITVTDTKTGQTTTIVVTVTAGGEINDENNLVVNGDFSLGNTGFTSDYEYVSQTGSSTLLEEGKYSVGTSPQNYHSGFIAHGDHTTGTGNMLIANGSTDFGKYVWKETVPVEKGKTYEFSAWFISVGYPSIDKNQIEYTINGSSNLGTYDKTENGWERYYWQYTATDTETIELKIRSIATDGYGNDFALDDITFCLASSQPSIPAYTSCPDNQHPHWIDLGLPSGTKWACCNAGTHAPEGYSLWLCDPSYFTFDEAQAYNPPSLDQIQELLDNTTSAWTTQNDMNGRLFTGNNGGSVFLPAAGFVLDNSLGHLGVCGFYWSSTSENGLFFNSYQTSLSHHPGSFGQCVRPVLRE